MKLNELIINTINMMRSSINGKSGPPSTIMGKGPTKIIILALVEPLLKSTRCNKTRPTPIRTNIKPKKISKNAIWPLVEPFSAESIEK